MPAYGPQLEELGKTFATAAIRSTTMVLTICRNFSPQERRIYKKDTLNYDADASSISMKYRNLQCESNTIGPEMIKAR